MKRWNTKEIMEKLSPFAEYIGNIKQISSYDTETIVMIARGADDFSRLYIRGFDHSIIDDPTDCDIEKIEITDGIDSRRGGLSTSDMPTCVMYGRIFSILRKMGFEILPLIDDWSD